MVRENEILSLLLGAGVLHFVILKISELKLNPTIGLLVPAFCMFFSAGVFNLAGTFFLETLFNLLEHLFYLFSALFLFAWALRLPLGKERPQA